MSIIIDNKDWIVSGIGASLVMAILQTIMSQRFKNENQKSEKLVEKIAEAATTNANNKKDIEWDFIENLINTYHKQALNQASIQFYFSVGAATTGFILIIVMVLTGANSGQFELVLKSLPGVAISSVAGLFFKQASETRQRATQLYDRLRKDKQIKEAISLVDSIDDNSIKAVIKAQIALNMSGMECAPVNTSDLFNKILSK